MRYDAVSSRVHAAPHVRGLRTLLLLLTLSFTSAMTACGGDDSGKHHDNEDAAAEDGGESDGSVIHNDGSTVPPRRDGGSDAGDSAVDMDATTDDGSTPTDDAGDATTGSTDDAATPDAATTDAAAPDAATPGDAAAPDAAMPHTLMTIEITPAASTVAKGTTQQFKANGIYADNTSADLTSMVTWKVADAATASISAAGVLSALQVGASTVSGTLAGITGSTAVTVSPATLSTLAVTPFSASLAPGINLQFSVTGTFSDGSTQDLTSVATWASSAATVATVDARGVVTAIAKGTSNISATAQGQSGSAALTVTDAVLNSIAINTVTTNLAAGTTAQLAAVGTFSDNSTQDLTKQVAWVSSDTSLLIVSNGAGTEGRATAVSPGNVMVTATVGSVTGSLALNISIAQLSSISITPANASFAAGTTQLFTATGVYSDGSTQNLTDVAVWSVGDATLATVSNDDADRGTATGIKAGSTTISAAVGATTGSAPITVSPATLKTISLSPLLSSVAKGSTKQFTATGTYSDSTTQDLTTQVTWASDNATFAAISNSAGSQGLASGLAQGTANITATLGAVSGTTSLTVTNATLQTITLTPVNPTLARGTTQQLAATGVYSDNSTQDLSATVSWSSSDTTAATVGNSGATAGLVTAVGAANGVDQLALITASLNGVNGSTTVHVTPATLQSIVVTAAVAKLPRNTTQQYTATGMFGDGTTQDITSTVTWSSSANNVASISNAARNRGLLTAMAAGTTTVSATRNGVTGSAMLTVSNANLTSVAVTPVGGNIGKGTTLQFHATASYDDMSTLDVTGSATWASSAEGVALVSNAAGSKGLVTAVGGGDTTIRASYQGQQGAQALHVSAATLDSITVTPANGTIALGHAAQYKATGNYSDATTQDLTTQVTWFSNHTNIAVVSNTLGSQGLVTPVAAGGPVTITATAAGGKSGSTNATVQ